MQVIVKAVDAKGAAIATEPLTRKDAIMKLWEMKTSGCTAIRSFDALTGATVDLVQKSDDEPQSAI